MPLETNTAKLENWCRIVHDCAVLRRIIDTCMEGAEKCFDSELSVDEIPGDVEKNVLEARTLGAKQKVIKMNELQPATGGFHENTVDCNGFNDLNALTF